MSNTIQLQNTGLAKIRDVDPLVVSYNIEMAEVTGGTFWKAYTPEEIAGTATFQATANTADMMQVYPPVNLYDHNIRRFGKALGASYVRVSGTWNTTTYWDIDDEMNGQIPEGYRAILTRGQWVGVLDFIRAVGAKLLISVANCEGNHSAHEPWDPTQARKLLDFSKAYGVPVDAIEFTNEPNAYEMTGTPKGYTAEDFGRDQDAFFRFIKKEYPEIVTVGPCSCFDRVPGTWLMPDSADLMTNIHTTDDLLANCKEKADIYSYHAYYNISDRAAAIRPHATADQALTENFLDALDHYMDFYGALQDKYLPGTDTWITEIADAGCGGDSWAPTCMEMVREADMVGRFTRRAKGILFHNTLAASAYGYLDLETRLPNPQYWVAYLYKQLIGTEVFDAKEPIREGAHIYAFSRKDGKPGYVYVAVNNSQEETSVTLPGEAAVYQLTGESLRSRTALLNGKPLVCTNDSPIPEVLPVTVSGSLTLPAVSVSFLVV